MSKNQNKCWYKIGSPPPKGTKNVVLKCRSVNNIVNPTAKTGTESNKRTDVTKIDQTYNGIFIHPLGFIQLIVVKKFIAPNKEENPAACSEKIK